MLAVLFGFDAVALSLAVWFGFTGWRAVNPTAPPFRPVLFLVPLCCLAQFAISGQYPGVGLTAVEHLRRTCRGVTHAYLLFTAGIFLADSLSIESRGAFSCSLVASLLLVPAGRWIATHLCAHRSWWGVPVLVIGGGEPGRAVIRVLKKNQILGYRPVACLHDDPGPSRQCEAVPIVGSLHDAAIAARRLNVGYAVVALPGTDRDQFLSYMRMWRSLFPRILIVPDLVGVASLWTETRDLGGAVALETRQHLLSPWNQFVKRAVDIVLAAFCLLISAPILVVCALWIRKVSPGSAFYRQAREGRNGRPIHIFKLRTMYHDAEGMLFQYLATDASARAEWDRFCKLKRDPRILPRVGAFLRMTSLDELPQLWNVLKGEMSLVGPRPFPEYHNSRFDPEFRRVRTQVTPGLTGLWQVSARSDGDLQVQQSLDSYYIRNWSLWLDMYILFRTARSVLARGGAY